jgi:tight adherence protein G
VRDTRSSRARDERGATLVLVAISMVLLLWGGAFGVDLGLTVVGGRQTQAIADTSALDMARYINVADWTTTLNSQTLSTTYLNGKLPYANTDNSSNATLTETPGVWFNNSFTAQGQKLAGVTVQCWYFKPPASHPCNAVKVTAAQSVPQIFVGGRSSVTRSAIAAVTPEAGFSVGSYLAAVNSQQSTVLNALLSKLGGTATVTAVGYQGLANTYVSINQLITASGGLLTSSNVMTTSLLGSQWLAIWSNAVANQVAQLSCGASPTPLPCQSSTALSALGSTASTSVQLCALVSINGSSCTSNSTLTTAALSTNLNALQTFTTEAEVANGSNAIDLGSSLGLPLVSDATLTLGLTAGQVPQVAYGPTSTTASTAQVSADLKLTVLGVTGLLDVPLTGAQATATLTGITCANNSMSSTTIQPAATTASGNVTLGGVSLSTLSVSGYSGSSFGYGPSVVPPTATTVSADSNPIVAGSNTPALSYSPAISTGSPVYSLLTSTLPAVLGPILQAVGISVGGVSVADLSTNCGAVSLVQ